MTPPRPSSVDEQISLTDYVTQTLLSRITGRAYGECTHNYPRDVYFVGNLRSEDGADDANANQRHLPELLTKLAPVAFGADFRLAAASPGDVTIQLEWSSYYRVFPTYQEQLEHSRSLTGRFSRNRALPVSSVQDAARPEDEDSSDSDHATEGEPEDGDETEAEAAAEAPAAPNTGEGINDVLLLKFRKVQCSANGLVKLIRAPDGNLDCDIDDLSAAVVAECTRAQAAAMADQERVRTLANEFEQLRVPAAAMASAATYDRFKGSLPNVIKPEWRWDIRFVVRIESDSATPILSTMFVNDSPRRLNAAGRESPAIEAYLFDTRAKFNFSSRPVIPFEISLAPKGFRYDPGLNARGFNCSIEQIDGQMFVSGHAPRFDQGRLVTQAKPSAAFDDLIKAPLPVLAQILAAMTAYCDVWQQQKEMFTDADPGWASVHGAEFEGDFSRFKDEIERFRRGYEVIQTNKDAALAFELTNRTFAKSGAHSNKKSWRLFQLVFLVQQIPGIVSLGSGSASDAADLENVDIIYFPTGGGKTEAYLSILAFHCFFDRLRGKTAGVTAWTRFPLRLLTLQQTQRVADIICLADVVRRAQSDERLTGKGVTGFGVGYFVGKTSTPNEIVSSDYRWSKPEDRAIWELASDAKERQSWRRLIHCPSCHTQTVRVDFDASKQRLLHVCANPGCEFIDGRIPVYVVDNEIYRYLPSVLVGTIDKLASIGSQRKVAQIFGQVDGVCAVHGYYKAQCCQKDCDNSRLNQKVPGGISAPTLFIQDELHLLKEGLGTFDGHYETFVQQLREEFGCLIPIKIIASSATIENFERQVEHLYGADPTRARIFPGLGPRLGESFYAHTLTYPQRVYLGLIPHNKTIFNAMLELLEQYHRILQELLAMPAGTPNPYGGQYLPGTSNWNELIDLYVTSLTYFLSNRDLNSIHTDLDGHVSPLLQSEQFAPIKILELTGSTSTDEVAASLEYLDKKKQGAERATAVLATNMVSHGVDIDRFNAMFFYGMPRQTAEYIQASSRVGRTHVGLVVVCHHPARERDRSHYELFAKYHEYLGQLVEPVAINRWATFSVNRTLPGLFMAILLQLLAGRLGAKKIGQIYKTDFVRQKITSGAIRPDDFVPFLEKAYRLNMANPAARAHFQAEIRLRVRQFLDNIIAAGPDKNFVSDTLIPRPMNSLRDVDEPIPIALDRMGTEWASRSHGRGGSP